MLVNCCSVEVGVEGPSNGVIVKETPPTALAIDIIVVSLIAVKSDSGSVITTV